MRENKTKGRRINISLNNKQIAFIDKIREGIKNDRNRKLSKDATIKAILRVGMGMKIKLGKIRTEKDLEEALKKSF